MTTKAGRLFPVDLLLSICHLSVAHTRCASSLMQYDQSVSTFSPDGRLYQVEYAMKAIEASGTAVGVRCKDGVIIGVEKLLAAKMLKPGSGKRVVAIDEHIGAATSGLQPDARQLVNRARDESKAYRQNYGQRVPPRTLADRMGGFTHMTTLYGSVRPFGASILLAGWDEESKQGELYCVEPSGLALRYFGCAIGKGQRAAKTELEKKKLFEMTVSEALGHVAKM
jgi:20S proteasome subunit alpha 7